MLELIVRAALRRAETVMQRALTEGLSEQTGVALERLVEAGPEASLSRLAWLRTASRSPASRNLLGLVERLRFVRSLGVPRDRQGAVPQIAFQRLVGEATRMTAQHLAEVTPPRRLALLVAVALHLETALTDATLSMFDKLMGSDGTLKISPLRAATPSEADVLQRQTYNVLPRVRITDLLLEVDAWTGFSECFNHQRSGRPAEDRAALLAAVLADGINLGLTRMAETSRDMTLRRLAWVHDWHVREECYVAAFTRLIEAHSALPLSSVWGDGTTSSSDWQFFRAGGRGEAIGNVNARHGNEPGVAFYTHISDQFGPFHTKVIAATASEAPHVLDGLLYHQTGLQIVEHYTDTGGATDHVFGLFALLGFRFAPRPARMGTYQSHR